MFTPSLSGSPSLSPSASAHTRRSPSPHGRELSRGGAGSSSTLYEGLDPEEVLYHGLRDSGATHGDAYKALLRSLSRCAVTGSAAPSLEKLGAVGRAVRATEGFAAVRRALLDMEGIEQLPVEAIGRLLVMMKPLLGVNPDKGWALQAQAAIGRLSPEFVHSFANQAQAYHRGVDQDERYQRLLAEQPDPERWNAEQRELALSILACPVGRGPGQGAVSCRAP